ncbi:sugar transferase [Asticcacaulis sp. MM231]|uniref:sugar transferase n=1 Tax=Asticcacaulis sp. MM231 TaxID=3157666 RepID=UPI0032D5984E
MRDEPRFAQPRRPERAASTRQGGAVSLNRFLVRACDLILCTLLILFLLPVFLTVALLIYLQDRGPVFFVQNRVGRHGRDFKCMKFRSMSCNADVVFQRYLDAHPHEAANWHEYRKLDRDPRITPIGRFIRKTSIDEFPQLINVLKGEMSLVGPRPIMRDEVEKYGPSYKVYKSMLPGITGLWQVMGRNNLTYRKRVVLDRVFAGKISITYYLTILVMTVPAVLLQRGSK